MSMKRRLLGGTALLIAAFSLTEVSAQTCAVPPTCESLGYDKNPEDCVDKAILKCPLDDTKIFCSNGPADGASPTPATQEYGGGTGPNGSYEIGNVLTCNGKQIGYVIEVSANGSGGKIAGLDYESDSNMSQSEGRELCKAKTDCNLVWNLVTKSELSLICQARKFNVYGVITSESTSYTWAATYNNSCNIGYTSSSYGEVSGKPYCTATFATDKVSGVTPTAPEPEPITYKVGDSYIKDGVALGTVVEVDSSGQHGIIAVSGGTGTAAEASAACSAKTQGGLNWSLATGAHACQIIKNAGTTCDRTYTGYAITCGIHSTSAPTACNNSRPVECTSSPGFPVDRTSCSITNSLGYICEAPF